MWTKGRQQGCDYHILTLWKFKIFGIGLDAYIIRYAPNSTLDWHIDLVPKKQHWRLNLRLLGNSKFETRHWKPSSRLVIFRPDLEEHRVLNDSKTVYKLSLGIAL